MTVKLRNLDWISLSLAVCLVKQRFAFIQLRFDLPNFKNPFLQVEELKPNGANIPVTSSNRIEYIHLVADYKLNKQIRLQCNAFQQVIYLNPAIFVMTFLINYFFYPGFGQRGRYGMVANVQLQRITSANFRGLHADRY